MISSSYINRPTDNSFYWNENAKVVLRWHKQIQEKRLCQIIYILQIYFQHQMREQKIITEINHNNKSPTKNDISTQYIWPVLLICIFSCDQAALWMVQSVRLSVCLSVTHFWLCCHHRTITKFSGVITNDKSDVHAKSQGQRSKVKVTEVKNRQIWPRLGVRTVTPVWIHQWLRNDEQSLK